jgi:electron transport complex protein RnfD
LQLIAGLAPRIDAMSGATPLDALKTALKLGEGSVDVPTLLATQEVFGNFAGRGWEWVSTATCSAASGCGSARSSPGTRRSVHRRPVAAGRRALAVEPAAVRQSALPSLLRRRDARRLLHRHRPGFRLHDAERQADLRLCSPALLAYIIRVFGGYPDGVAFAVLLMNLCVPLIDMYTQPPIFGMKNEVMTPPVKTPTAPKMAVRTAVILLIFVVVFTGLLAAAYLWTGRRSKPRPPRK